MGIFKASLAVMIPVVALSQSTVAQQRGTAQPQGVREAGAVWTRAWQGTDNADGLVASDDGGLLFAQEQPNQVSKLDVNDRVSVFLRDTHGAGALSIATDGRVLAVERTCTDPGRNAAAGPCTDPTVVGVLAPERKIIADSFDGKPIGRLNDLAADKKGGAYFTSGGAFYASAAGGVTSLGDNIRANGIILSRDDRIVYVTNGNTILAFDVQADGTATNRREFATLEAGGSGDGMTIDAAGRVYVTSGPGVQVFDVLIPTPRSVISVAFSGPGKKTLYVVGSGASGPDGREFVTPEGVRNNAKTIYRIPMIAEGFLGRPK